MEEGKGSGKSGIGGVCVCVCYFLGFPLLIFFLKEREMC